jgi:hypothetical protein
MMSNLSISEEYREAVGRLKGQGEDLGRWYFYYFPFFRRSRCFRCGSIVFYGHILLDMSDFENAVHYDVCSFCLRDLFIYQRDFDKRVFWEDWGDNGVEMVCLRCGSYLCVEGRTASAGAIFMSGAVKEEENFHLTLCQV